MDAPRHGPPEIVITSTFKKVKFKHFIYFLLNYGFNNVKEYEALVEGFELFVGAAEHERVLAFKMMIDGDR